jgi:hypothetical protein
VNTPYDDIGRWCPPYPPDILEEQFRIMSDAWKPGLDILDDAASSVEGEHAEAMAELNDIATATYCHFRTSYLQLAFVLHRNEHGFVLDEKTQAIIQEELELAKTLYDILRRDSRIGFEATNHYYYTENDLVEKVLNCEQLLSQNV